MRTERQQAASLRHLELARSSNASRRIKHVCEQCGKERSVAPSVLRRGLRFCSLFCRYQFMRGPSSPNWTGGEWMRGKQNPNWKDGNGYERGAAHARDIRVRHWRREVFSRDGYTCQQCKAKPKATGQLNAHHIEPWASNPERRFDITNGVTLCLLCHRLAHKRS